MIQIVNEEGTIASCVEESFEIWEAKGWKVFLPEAEPEPERFEVSVGKDGKETLLPVKAESSQDVDKEI